MLIAGGGLLAGLALLVNQRRPSTSSVELLPTSNPLPDGRLAAATHCQQCHLLPDPALQDRRTWREELLPRMRYFTGMQPPTTNAFKDLYVLLGTDAFLGSPAMTEDAWKALADYYISSAPEKLFSPQDQEQIQIGLKGFAVVPARFRRSPPRTTLARIDSERHMILMADAEPQTVDFLDPRGNRISSVPLGNIAVGLSQTPDAYWFAAIGHFFPREEPHGQVLKLEKTPEGFRRTAVLSDLPRTTDVQLADFNYDQRIDLAVCMYGNYVGRFSWFENTSTNGYVEHVLVNKPGALKSAVHDFNNDGRPDLAVLFAQALESLFVFINDGKGRFTQHLILQRQPSWGHSGFSLADFNGDGRMDFLVTNGDNADFSTSPTKPYHGVRIFLNKGNLQFEEAWFFHLNGAYQAVARDFDKDGDLDIAVVSFFPDYEHSPRESFVYLENQGGLNFTASTFPECIAGRWLTVDAGDLDGDGYDDLVLGSLTQVPAPTPEALKKNWEAQGPSLIILRNTTGQAPKKP
jgi:hypothetical protein